MSTGVEMSSAPQNDCQDIHLAKDSDASFSLLKPGDSDSAACLLSGDATSDSLISAVEHCKANGFIDQSEFESMAHEMVGSPSPTVTLNRVTDAIKEVPMDTAEHMNGNVKEPSLPEEIPGPPPLSSKARYICTSCGRQFRMWNRLVAHSRIHRGVRLHKCGSCGQSFVHQSLLVRHRYVHITGRRNSDYPSSSALSAPTAACSSEQEATAPAGAEASSWQSSGTCERLNGGTEETSNMRLHRPNTRRARLRSCVFCHQQLPSAAALQLHQQRWHRGERMPSGPGVFQPSGPLRSHQMATRPTAASIAPAAAPPGEPLVLKKDDLFLSPVAVPPGGAFDSLAEAPPTTTTTTAGEADVSKEASDAALPDTNNNECLLVAAENSPATNGNHVAASNSEQARDSDQAGVKRETIADADVVLKPENGELAKSVTSDSKETSAGSLLAASSGDSSAASAPSTSNLVTSTPKRKWKRKPKAKVPYNAFGKISQDGTNILAGISIEEGIDVNAAAAEAGKRAIASGAPVPLDRKGRPCSFPCPACPRRFAFQCRLAAHLRCHTNIRPFICQDCGRAFTQKGYLARHAAVHKFDRPFTCKLCERTYKHYGSLVNHRRTHGRPDRAASGVMTSVAGAASGNAVTRTSRGGTAGLAAAAANRASLTTMANLAMAAGDGTNGAMATMNLQQQLQQQNILVASSDPLQRAAALGKANPGLLTAAQPSFLVAQDGSSFIITSSAQGATGHTLPLMPIPKIDDMVTATDHNAAMANLQAPNVITLQQLQQQAQLQQQQQAVVAAHQQQQSAGAHAGPGGPLGAQLPPQATTISIAPGQMPQFQWHTVTSCANELQLHATGTGPTIQTMGGATATQAGGHTQLLTVQPPQPPQFFQTHDGQIATYVPVQLSSGDLQLQAAAPGQDAGAGGPAAQPVFHWLQPSQSILLPSCYVPFSAAPPQ